MATFCKMDNHYLSILSAICLMFISVMLIPFYAMDNLNLFISLKHILYGESYESIAELTEYYGDNHPSSVWCLVRLDNTKICHLKNLYYFPELKGHLLFVLNEHSTISGIKTQSELQGINLSSVKNLTSVNLKLIIIQSFDNLHLQQQTVMVINEKTLIMQRFKPDNIMHVIHDDLLPLYFTFDELCQGDIELCHNSYHLTFLDNFEEGQFIEWYKIFSNHAPILLKNTETALCLKDSVIGLSKESVWFHYGYKNVHGPVVDTNFSGIKLKQFSRFVKRKLNIISGSEEESVVFLNRKINRRILNDKFLEEKIQQIYYHLKNIKVKVVSLDLSTNDSRQILLALQNTKLLVGMHGSAMILGIFLPENSYIFELFPFGIQPYFVSPIKALCSLKKVSYIYNSWVNENESNSVTHPEFHPLLGGITHLPLNKQVAIKNLKLVPPVECCHNPFYLFRMFQDTIVDDRFFELFRRVVNDGTREDSNNVSNYQFYFPPPVVNLTCQCVSDILVISWKFPFTRTRVRFSVATNTGKNLETRSLHLSIDDNRCRHVKKEAKDPDQDLFVVSVWVKVFENDQESLDSYSMCFHSESLKPESENEKMDKSYVVEDNR